jgi:hypothetical protein
MTMMMMRIQSIPVTLLVLVVASASGHATLQQHGDDPLFLTESGRSFLQWVQLHDQQYDSREELMERWTIWSHNNGKNAVH